MINSAGFVLKIICLLFASAILATCSSGPSTVVIPALTKSAEKLQTLGVKYYNEYKFEKARILFEKSLHAYRTIDQPEGIATSCINLARTLLAIGQTQQAKTCLKKARTLIRGAQLQHLSDHIAIIESSIAIEDKNFAHALTLLLPLLDNSNTATRIAAIQNRARIAFIENNDPEHWVEEFSSAVSHFGKQSSQQARLQRFKASLSANANEQNRLYKQALTIYRDKARSTSIASTLTEWAEKNITHGDYSAAIANLEKSLFIRHSLRDKKRSLAILNKLQLAHEKSGNSEKSEQASIWAEELKKETFDQWKELIRDFDPYVSQAVTGKSTKNSKTSP